MKSSDESKPVVNDEVMVCRYIRTLLDTDFPSSSPSPTSYCSSFNSTTRKPHNQRAGFSAPNTEHGYTHHPDWLEQAEKPSAGWVPSQAQTRAHPSSTQTASATASPDSVSLLSRGLPLQPPGHVPFSTPQPNRIRLQLDKRQKSWTPTLSAATRHPVNGNGRSDPCDGLVAHHVWWI
jgi:hypothetical protein